MYPNLTRIYPETTHDIQNLRKSTNIQHIANHNMNKESHRQQLPNRYFGAGIRYKQDCQQTAQNSHISPNLRTLKLFCQHK